MELCVHCKAEKTELYENGSPICLECAELRKFRPKKYSRDVQDTLFQALAEATRSAHAALQKFDTVTSDVPSHIPHPDGVQRILAASQELTHARNEMMKAHHRLNDFIEHGIVPDDLKPAND